MDQVGISLSLTFAIRTQTEDGYTNLLYMYHKEKENAEQMYA